MAQDDIGKNPLEENGVENVKNQELTDAARAEINQPAINALLGEPVQAAASEPDYSRLFFTVATLFAPLFLVGLLIGAYGWANQNFVGTKINQKDITESVNAKSIKTVTDEVAKTSGKINGNAEAAADDNCYARIKANSNVIQNLNRDTNINPAQHGYRGCIAELSSAAEQIQEQINERTEAIDAARRKDCIETANSDKSKCGQADAKITESDATKTLVKDRDEFQSGNIRLQSGVNTFTKQKDAAQLNITKQREQLGKRYGHRLVWVFLTAILLLLCLACVVITWFIAYKSLGETVRGSFIWLVVTGIIAFITVVVIGKLEYMSMVKDIMRQSMEVGEEISLATIENLLLMVFFTCVFLVSASCIVLYAVTQTEKKDDSLWAEKLNDYAVSMKHLKMILYVGTLMLLIGLVRALAMSQWHLVFLSEKSDIDVLSGFTQYSHAVQGGFFTLLLAVVYLPGVYIIRNKARAELVKAKPAASTKDIDKELEDRGFVFSYADFIKRFFLIISPLMAGSFGGLLKGFFDIKE